MATGHDIVCVLCRRSEENRITGALSTKDLVTAHQNCLLYSSGLFCRESPQFDDLFGFSTQDVMTEMKRGSRLTCSRCKKKGATVGCEVKRCQKSYHYPCAIEENAKARVDKRSGSYRLYCRRHYEKIKKSHSSENSTKTCNSNEASSSRSCWEKHTSSSYEMVQSDDDSNSSSKRQLDVSDQQEENVAKRWKRKGSEDLTNSDIDADAMFAPLDSDLEENANSAPDKLLNRKDSTIAGSDSGTPKVDEHENGKNNSSVDCSDADSQSLLPTPQRNKSTNHQEGGSINTLPSDKEFSIDSISFWKDCNTAGCTQAIFSDFIDEITDIFHRINSEEASQQDCDMALKVMMASGKLTELVAKQQKDLEKKQTELQQAAVALNSVVSSLKR